MTNPWHRSTALLRQCAETVLARSDLQIVRKSSLDTLGWNDSPAPDPGACDESVPVDLDRLRTLAGRYRGHPAAETGALWSAAYQQQEIDIRSFRADNAYLWQTRDHHVPIRYALTALYARLFDPLKLWGRLAEDGAFGAHVVDIDGVAISRDLLDSIIELNFLEEALEISSKRFRVIDIGAGYGRLAHRATAAAPMIEYVCTDGIALSTVLCETYLQYRRTERTAVVPLDEVSVAVSDSHFDLAVNIHSFSECPLAAIDWWAQLMADGRVPYLMLVPSGGLQSQERDGSRHDYLPVLERAGYRIVLRRPKFAHSESVQRYGIFPAEHVLLELQQ